MAKKSVWHIVASSFILASVLMINLIAIASFFFIQVGSILFIVPAGVIDAFYMLNREQIGPVKGSAKPSIKIMKLAFVVITVCLVTFSALFIFEVIQAS